MENTGAHNIDLILILAIGFSVALVLGYITHRFGWSSIVGLNIFMPQYLQNVVGLTPTNAGLTLIAFMIALNVSAGASGHVLCRVVHYKTLPMVGLAVSISALLVLAWNVDRVSHRPAGRGKAISGSRPTTIVSVWCRAWDHRHSVGSRNSMNEAR